jgi:photosystem II stability/assembly factor-like uncharacterized protein
MIKYWLKVSLLLPAIIHAQEFWKATNGPYGGHVRTMFVDSTNKIWVGTFNGIFTSSDEGESWSKQGTYGQFGEVPTNFSVNSKGKIYITHYWGGFKSSIDQGQTYQDVTLPGFYDVRHLYIDKMDRIFACTNEGIYRSLDDGQTWQLISPITDSYALSEGPDGRIYSSRNYGIIYYSTDYGDTWHEPDTMIIPPMDHIVHSDFAFNSKGDIFGGSINGILFSRDKGKTWHLSRIDTNYIFVYSVSIDKNDKIYAGTTKGIFMSESNAETWEKIELGYKSLVAFMTCVDSSGNVFSALNNDLIIRSSDGGKNWVIVTENLQDVSLISIDIDSSDNIIVGSESGSLYYSSNKGQIWQGIFSIPTLERITSIQLKAENIIYAGTDGDGIFKSINKGQTWEVLNDSSQYMYIKSLFIDHSGRLFIGTTYYTYMSLNNGQTWTKVLSAGSRNFRQNSNGLIFAGTDNGIYRLNSDNKWEILDNGIPEYIYVTSLATQNNMVFAGTPFGGIFYSLDYGDSWDTIREEDGGTWKTIRNENDGEPVYPIAINSEGIIYISFPYDIGLQQSADSGKTWSALNTWAGNDMVFDRNGYMITMANGVFFSVNSTITSLQQINKTGPDQYILFQNYPNPFNPKTHFKFNLPKTSSVDISIYNIEGQFIGYLINEKKSAGIYVITWDASNFPSGMYFIRLKAENFSATKKCLLIK